MMSAAFLLSRSSSCTASWACTMPVAASLTATQLRGCGPLVVHVLQQQTQAEGTVQQKVQVATLVSIPVCAG